MLLVSKKRKSKSIFSRSPIFNGVRYHVNENSSVEVVEMSVQSSRMQCSYNTASCGAKLWQRAYDMTSTMMLMVVLVWNLKLYKLICLARLKQ